MARARRRLDERFGGGQALGVTESGTTLRFGGEGEAHTPPRAASVAGYKQKRDAALALKARQRTMRSRAAQGPETPAQSLARLLGIGETEAYHAARNPYFGRFVQAHVRHGQRMTEIDRMQTGRMDIAKLRTTTARDMLGKRLGVTEKIAAAREAGYQKRDKESRARLDAALASREQIEAQKAEAAAGSAAGKAEMRKKEQAAAAKAKDVAAKDKVEQEKLDREVKRLSGHRDNLVKRLEKLQDTAAQQGATDTDKRNLEDARKALTEFDAKKELDKAYEALQAFKPTPTAGGEAEAPTAQPGPTTQPAATQPAAPQFQTSAEAIAAIKTGQFDPKAPGSEEVFLSLPPEVQEEVRAWLRKNGYLD